MRKTLGSHSVAIVAHTAYTQEHFPVRVLSGLGVEPHREVYMLRSKLALIATMALLSTGFVLLSPVPADAAKFCAQLRGAKASGEPDCSFSTLDACRERVKHRGGGHCYKMTHSPA